MTLFSGQTRPPSLCTSAWGRPSCRPLWTVSMGEITIFPLRAPIVKRSRVRRTIFAYGQTASVGQFRVCPHAVFTRACACRAKRIRYSEVNRNPVSPCWLCATSLTRFGLRSRPPPLVLLTCIPCNAALLPSALYLMSWCRILGARLLRGAVQRGHPGPAGPLLAQAHHWRRSSHRFASPACGSRLVPARY